MQLLPVYNSAWAKRLRIEHCKITVKPREIYNAPHCKFTMRCSFYNAFTVLYNFQCSHCNFTMDFHFLFRGGNRKWTANRKMTIANTIAPDDRPELLRKAEKRKRAGKRRHPNCIFHGAPPRLPESRTVGRRRRNFRKSQRVCGCIGTELCKKIRILQQFSETTR
jgi:hypothetical protein